MKLKRPPKHPNTPGVPRVPTQQGHFHTEKWDKSHPGRWEEGAGCSADGISTFRCWLYSSIPQNFKSNSASVAVLCTVNTVYLPTAQPRVTDDNSYSLTPGATPPPIPSPVSCHNPHHVSEYQSWGVEILSAARANVFRTLSMEILIPPSYWPQGWEWCYCSWAEDIWSRLRSPALNISALFLLPVNRYDSSLAKLTVMIQADPLTYLEFPMKIVGEWKTHIRQSYGSCDHNVHDRMSAAHSRQAARLRLLWVGAMTNGRNSLNSVSQYCHSYIVKNTEYLI